MAQATKHTPLPAKKRRKLFMVAAALTGLVVCTLGLLILKGALLDGPSIPESGPIPTAGTQYGGVLLPRKAGPAPATSIDWTKLPAPAAEPGPAGTQNVVLYLDPNCVHCADFERDHSIMLKAKVAAGHITLETRAVAFLDKASPSNYSSRAANAMACVANADPEKYLTFTTAIFQQYGKGELSNAQLTDLAAEKGVPGLSTCITDGTFRPFVKTSTLAAASHGITGTPAIFIDGKPFPLGADLEKTLTPARK